jgi:hypothetical protein
MREQRDIRFPRDTPVPHRDGTIDRDAEIVPMPLSRRDAGRGCFNLGV